MNIIALSCIGKDDVIITELSEIIETFVTEKDTFNKNLFIIKNIKINATKNHILCCIKHCIYADLIFAPFIEKINETCKKINILSEEIIEICKKVVAKG